MIAPSGEQITITAGDQQAVVVEVGAFRLHRVINEPAMLMGGACASAYRWSPKKD
jgi:hypothetical protein